MLKPRHNYVLIEINKKDDNKNSSGIVQMDNKRARQNKGIILDIGPDVPSDLSVGLKVYFHEHSGITVIDPDKILVLMIEVDVIGT